MVATSLSGIHSRPASLIKATRDFEKKRLDKEQCDAAFRDAAQSLAMHQKGLTYVSDGQLLWQDIFRPFSESVDGIEIGALTRWFENNTFFKQPVVKSQIASDGSFIENYVNTDLLDGRGKVVLPGPYTFAKLCANKHYPDWSAVMKAFSDVLNCVCKRLAAKGVKYVQLNEPAIVYHETRPKDSDFEKILQSISTVRKGVGCRFCANFFFGDFAKVQRFAQNLPVDVIGIDMTSTTLSGLRSMEKDVCLGVVDGRNSLLESVAEIRSSVLRAGEKGLNCTEISPSCDMEFLPWEVSLEKIKILEQAGREING